MPSSWDEYGVDANGDGVKDPYNPEDAIFAAASYLSVAGMPADTYGAIFAYNHADWYVSEVLANAGCYAARSRRPRLRRRRPRAADPGPAAAAPPRTGRRTSPPTTCEAFEDAAARYELGKRGVWALAAVARLESNFGRGMSKKELRSRRAARARPDRVGASTRSTATTTATSATPTPPTRRRPWRGVIWSRGSLSAGIFTHNQAEWYVAGGDAAGRTDRRRLQGQLRRLARGAARRPGSKPPGPSARSSTPTASPAPRAARRRR